MVSIINRRWWVNNPVELFATVNPSYVFPLSPRRRSIQLLLHFILRFRQNISLHFDPGHRVHRVASRAVLPRRPGVGGDEQRPARGGQTRDIRRGQAGRAARDGPPLRQIQRQKSESQVESKRICIELRIREYPFYIIFQAQIRHAFCSYKELMDDGE